MEPEKVLVIRFSTAGDIVLTTPVIRTLKTKRPDSEIHYCTLSTNFPVLEANPYLDKIHLLDKDISSLTERLEKENFDYIIDLENSFRTRLIKMRLGIKSKSPRKLRLEKWLMVNFKINKLPNRHIVDWYMDTVSGLGIKMDSLGLDYFIPDDQNVDLSMLPAAFRKEFVAFAISASYKTRQLPLKRLIELCDKINKPVLLLGDEADFETGEKICRFFEKNERSFPFEEGLKELNKKTQIFNGCGKYSINETASLLKQASYVFCHDNDLMHIASAFKKQIFCIWGNTIPLFGKYPYRTRFTIFENNRIDCRPCSKNGFDKCPKGHFKCMNDVIFDFYLP